MQVPRSLIMHASSSHCDTPNTMGSALLGDLILTPSSSMKEALVGPDFIKKWRTRRVE